MLPKGLSMKNSNDNIGNRTHDLPACSAVPQQLVGRDSKIAHNRGHPLYESYDHAAAALCPRDVVVCKPPVQV